jgi:hypothetical protein
MPSRIKQFFIFSMKIDIYLISRMMKMKNTHAFITTLLLFLAFTAEVGAIEAKSPALLSCGEAEVVAAAGAVVLPDEKVIGLELSLRVGLLPRLEFAGPLGLSLGLIEYEDAGALLLSFGIADIYLADYKEFIYRPTVMLAGVYYIGRGSTVRGAVDLSGAEQGLTRNAHPAWIRGSMAVIIDVGRLASIAAGISYQRIVISGEHPPKLDRTGWAYDARISFGSVQVLPFSELPVLSIHMHPNLDFIAISKMDVNTDTGKRSFRLLLGFSIMR